MHSRGFRTFDPQRSVMDQSTEMSPLVSMPFRTFLNLLKFLMEIFSILVSVVCVHVLWTVCNTLAGGCPHFSGKFTVVELANSWRHFTGVCKPRFYCTGLTVCCYPCSELLVSSLNILFIECFDAFTSIHVASSMKC